MGEPNWSEVIQAVAAVLGVVGIGGALVYSGLQAKGLQQQVQMQTEADERGRRVEQAQLDLSLMSLMMELDTLFVERPHLYPYFNDNEAIPHENACLRSEVLSCAELILDYADMIARQQRCGQIPDDDEKGWIELLSSYYEGSPAVRDQFKRFERGYQAGVRKLLDIDLGEVGLPSKTDYRHRPGGIGAKPPI
jgi:hypothetical protein